MEITLIASVNGGEIHGTRNAKKTGCGINLLKPENVSRYIRKGPMTDLKELTCEKCKAVLAKEMIKADKKEFARLIKEEKARTKKGLGDEGIVPLGNTTAKITKSPEERKAEERAERERAEAAEKAERERIEAERKAEREAEEARQRAEEAERARIAEEEARKAAANRTIPGTGIVMDSSLAQFAINVPKEEEAETPSSAAPTNDDFLNQFAINKPVEETPAQSEETVPVQDDFLAQFAVNAPSEQPQGNEGSADANGMNDVFKNPEAPKDIVGHGTDEVGDMNDIFRNPEAPKDIFASGIQHSNSEADDMNDIFTNPEVPNDIFSNGTIHHSQSENSDIMDMFSISADNGSEILSKTNPDESSVYDSDENVVDIAENEVTAASAIEEEINIKSSTPAEYDTSLLGDGSEWDAIANRLFGSPFSDETETTDEAEPVPEERIVSEPVEETPAPEETIVSEPAEEIPAPEEAAAPELTEEAPAFENAENNIPVTADSPEAALEQLNEFTSAPAPVESSPVAESEPDSDVLADTPEAALERLMGIGTAPGIVPKRAEYEAPVRAAVSETKEETAPAENVSAMPVEEIVPTENTPEPMEEIAPAETHLEPADEIAHVENAPQSVEKPAFTESAPMPDINKTTGDDIMKKQDAHKYSTPVFADEKPAADPIPNLNAAAPAMQAPMAQQISPEQPIIMPVPQFAGYDANGQPVYTYVQSQFMGYDVNGQPMFMPIQPINAPVQPVVPMQTAPMQNTAPVQNAAPVQNTEPVLNAAPMQNNAPVQPTATMQNTVPVQPTAPIQPAPMPGVQMNQYRTPQVNISKVGMPTHKTMPKSFAKAVSVSRENSQNNIFDIQQGKGSQMPVLESIEDAISNINDDVQKQKKTAAKTASPVFQEYKGPSKSTSSRKSAPAAPASPGNDRPLTKAELKALKKQEKIDQKFKKDLAKRGF